MKTIHIYTSASLFPYNDATLSAHDDINPITMTGDVHTYDITHFKQYYLDHGVNAIIHTPKGIIDMEKLANNKVDYGCDREIRSAHDLRKMYLAGCFTPE